MNKEYDIIVIGAGSGGLVVASGAAGIGAKVLLIEGNKMGGDCLNTGCVPSKTFLKSTHLAKQMDKAQEYGFENVTYEVSLEKIMERVQKVISEIEPHDSKERFESLGVDVVFGYGKIIEKNKVMVGDEVFVGRKIVIATGTKAFIPPIKGLDTVDYYTNENIFTLKELPKEMIVLGGGPIGLELGQGFSSLGTKVHIVDLGEKLFSKDEPEVWDVMKEVFEEDKLNLHLKNSIMEVKKEGEKIKVITTYEGETKEIQGEVLLVALGRIPNTKDIALEEVGLKLNERGFVVVNDKLQSSIETIYACGDVRGRYQFTHTAGYEAGIVIRNSLIAPVTKVNYENISWSTYTSPEVAHVGLTEKEAIEQDLFGGTLLKKISENDRAKAEDDRHGFVKIVLNKKGQIVGGTIVGNKAGEMIATLGLMVTEKMKLSKVLKVIYPYPTESEIFKAMAIEHMKNNAKDWQLSILKKFIKR